MRDGPRERSVCRAVRLSTGEALATIGPDGMGGCNSGVEYLLPKQNVVGSNPITRSKPLYRLVYGTVAHPIIDGHAFCFPSLKNSDGCRSKIPTRIFSSCFRSLWAEFGNTRWQKCARRSRSVSGESGPTV